MNFDECFHLPNFSLSHWQDVTQGQFSNSVLVWINSFPSSNSVATPKLKRPVCSTIYPYLWGGERERERERERGWIHVFQKGISMKAKCKKSHPRFELLNLMNVTFDIYLGSYFQFLFSTTTENWHQPMSSCPDVHFRCEDSKETDKFKL